MAKHIEILESNGGKTVKQAMCKCGVSITYVDRFWYCYNDACETTNISDADFDSKEVRND